MKQEIEEFSFNFYDIMCVCVYVCECLTQQQHKNVKISYTQLFIKNFLLLIGIEI